jgi:hypothetical protein
MAMRIKMLKSKHGSPDGATVKLYEGGAEYSVPDDLGHLFVNHDKVAEIVEGEKAEAPVKNKAEKPVKNKAE